MYREYVYLFYTANKNIKKLLTFKVGFFSKIEEKTQMPLNCKSIMEHLFKIVPLALQMISGSTPAL